MAEQNVTVLVRLSKDDLRRIKYALTCEQGLLQTELDKMASKDSTWYQYTLDTLKASRETLDNVERQLNTLV